jgi:hypothetical protein
MSSYYLDHLQYLETEAIHVMREVVAELNGPRCFPVEGFDLPASPC